jgi:hypothetical protein
VAEKFKHFMTLPQKLIRIAPRQKPKLRPAPRPRLARQQRRLRRLLELKNLQIWDPTTHRPQLRHTSQPDRLTAA